MAPQERVKRSVMIRAALLIALLTLAGCSAANTCTARTCPTGCCDAAGSCQGASNSNCPNLSGQCVSCLPGVCSAQGCIGGTGGGGGAGGGTGGSTGTFDAEVAACNQVADALVAIDVRCGLITSAGMGAFRNQLTIACASVPSSVKTGKQQLASVLSCVNTLSALSCREIPTPFLPNRYGGPGIWSVCDDLLAGTVALSLACTSTQDCVSGLYCGRTTCPFSCLQKLADGQAVTGSEQCLSFAVYDGKCAAAVAVGGSCVPTGTSTSNRPCATPTRCASGTCQFPADVGGPCGAQCREGLRCSGGTCQPLLDENQSCGPASCFHDLTCISSTCVRNIEGAACSGDPDCVAPSAYFCSAGRCRSLPSANSMCHHGQSAYCLNGSWCDLAADVCRANIALGGSCTTSGSSCVAGLYCDGTRCTAKRTTGPCQSSTECVGRCSSGQCTECP